MHCIQHWRQTRLSALPSVFLNFVNGGFKDIRIVDKDSRNDIHKYTRISVNTQFAVLSCREAVSCLVMSGFAAESRLMNVIYFLISTSLMRNWRATNMNSEFRSIKVMRPRTNTPLCHYDNQPLMTQLSHFVETDALIEHRGRLAYIPKCIWGGAYRPNVTLSLSDRVICRRLTVETLRTTLTAMTDGSWRLWRGHTPPTAV